MSNDDPDPRRALARYREHAANYDASALRTLPLRYRRIWNLGLHEGDAFLDVACGTGMSFALIEEAAVAPLGPFDAVAFNFTHDVLHSEAALANIFAACRPGARVAVAGSKLLPWHLAPFNPYVRWNNAPYMTTQRDLAKPWRRLRRYVPDLAVTPALFGACYLAKGTFAPHPSPLPAARGEAGR